MCICAQFMHIVYAHLFNCAWPITTARYWIIFRTVIICDTESIKATKVKKIAKKLIFALFCTIYAHYAYLINYAWTKTSITCWETFRTIIICNMELIWATKVEKKANVHMCTIYAHAIYAHYAYLFNCARPKTTARCWEIFRTAIICDTESIRATKVKKMVKKITFALFLHNLCTLCIPN